MHRDIKPANIFVTRRGQAKLSTSASRSMAESAADARGDTAQPTAVEPSDSDEPGHGLGTVAYMSPEQARGEALDARTDLFSFGAVLYEMATGRQPFAGNTTAMVFDAILNQAPVSPAPAQPDAARRSSTRIISKALEKDRDLRYQSAAELRRT